RTRYPAPPTNRPSRVLLLVGVPPGDVYAAHSTLSVTLAGTVATLISLSNAPFGGSGWHIMPVVDSNETELTLLSLMHTDGTADIRALAKSELVRIHDQYPGGNDVAYLE
ncbi:MAG: hypothetical protein ACT4TC_11325, partial [Myxococcaceae bacterium]